MYQFQTLSLVLSVALAPILVSAYSPSTPRLFAQSTATRIQTKGGLITNDIPHPSSTSALFNSVDDTVQQDATTPTNPINEVTKPTNATTTTTTTVPPAPPITPSSLKQSLLENVQKLQSYMEIDGDFSIDFGVKGGELNSTSRAPRKVDYYTM